MMLFPRIKLDTKLQTGLKIIILNYKRSGAKRSLKFYKNTR